MPWVGFEPTIPAFERAKTVHALDRAATVTGISAINVLQSGMKARMKSGNSIVVAYICM
jgi:hypothetical protein